MLLKVDGLSKDFGGLRALDSVSFEVKEHELVGLIGPNGAGKTTLFNCISGHIPVTEGKILFDGKDITGLPPHQRAKLGLARTFQVYAAQGDLNVLEYTMVGAFLRTNGRRKAKDIALETLKELDLLAWKERKVSEIPVPGQKLVTMAVAVATNPKLLLLDEVAAGLNPQEIGWVKGIISHIHKDLGITTVLIEHVMALVMDISQRVVVLDAGRVIKEGRPQEVVNDPAVIKAYLGESFRLEETR
ncbi:MAG: ABC transporter ATP-binding protein [Desulfatiglandales bacterium]